MPNEYHFGESSHRARIAHHCDFCMNDINPGQEYSRRIWVTNGGHFIVLREHLYPSCPLDEIYEGMREEREANVSVSICIEVRAVAVQKIAINGDTVTETEMQFVSVVGGAEPEPESHEDYDKEIPF